MKYEMEKLKRDDNAGHVCADMYNDIISVFFKYLECSIFNSKNQSQRCVVVHHVRETPNT